VSYITKDVVDTFKEIMVQVCTYVLILQHENSAENFKPEGQ